MQERVNQSEQPSDGKPLVDGAALDATSTASSPTPVAPPTVTGNPGSAADGSSRSATARRLSPPQGPVGEERTVISKRPPVVEPPLLKPALSPFELGRTLQGKRLGHFQLEGFVGGGGMGAVFRAHDTMLGRTVAVKVLSRDQTDEDTLRRFQNEAQSAARLDHLNIARVYYVGEDQGLHYIVFEFIEGENIRDLVLTLGPLPLSDAVHYTLQVAEALDHASHRDVVHRDIKPSNVLVMPDGHVKLVDMGLARLHQVEASEADLTASGVTLGTFDYISPEQARDPRSADVRSDLYSLGCTLYFMLTGKPPFPQGTVLQKLLSHSSEAPPDVRTARPDLGEETAAIVRKLLAKQPLQRYQTPSELIAALILLADHQGLGNVGQQGRFLVTPTTPRIWRAARHAPWIATAALLLVFVLGLRWFAPATPVVSLDELRPSYVGSGGPIIATDSPPVRETSPSDFRTPPATDAPPAVSPNAVSPTANSPSAAALNGGSPASGSPASGANRASSSSPAEAASPTGGTLAPAAFAPAAPRAGAGAPGPTDVRPGDVGTSKLPAGERPNELIAPAEINTERAPTVPEPPIGAGKPTRPAPNVSEGAGPLVAPLPVRTMNVVPELPGAGGAASSAPTSPIGAAPAALVGPSTGASAGSLAAASPAAIETPAATELASPNTIYVGETQTRFPAGARRAASLAEAVQQASETKDVSVVELWYDGERTESPLSLPALALEVRAGRGFQPIVAFSPSSGESLAARHPIRQTAGESRWRGVHLRWNLPSEPYEGWSLFQIAGGVGLELVECSLTIRNSDREGDVLQDRVAFVQLVPAPAPETTRVSADERQGMMTRTPPSTIAVDASILRGQATLVDAPEAAPFRLSLHHVLFASTERLVELGGALAEPTLGDAVQIDLRHVTAVVGKGLGLAKVDGNRIFPLEMVLNCQHSIVLTGAKAPLLEQRGVASQPYRKLPHVRGKNNFYPFTKVILTVDAIGQGAGAEFTEYTFSKRERARDEKWYEDQPEPGQVDWRNLPRSTRRVDLHTRTDYLIEDDPDGAVQRLAGFDPLLLPDLGDPRLRSLGE